MDNMESRIDPSIFKAALILLLAERRESVSASFIQRKLEIGYNQACDITSLMEQQGIVSPPLPGGQRRDILMTPQEISLVLEELEKDLDVSSCQNQDNSNDEIKDIPMIDKAIKVIQSEKRGSVSLLQRGLGIGYNRAVALLSSAKQMIKPLDDDIIFENNDEDINKEQTSDINASETIDETNIPDTKYDDSFLWDLSKGVADSNVELLLCIFRESDTISVKRLMSAGVWDKKKSTRIINDLKSMDIISGPIDAKSQVYFVTKPDCSSELRELFYNLQFEEYKKLYAYKVKHNIFYHLFDESIGFLWRERYVLMVLAIILLFGYVYYQCEMNGVNKQIKEKKERYGDEFMVKSTARDAVPHFLKCPSTVRFARDEIAYRNDLQAIDFAKEKGVDPNRVWTVVGSFDAQNSFGAMVRSKYIAVILFEHKNEYRVLNIEILE